MEYKEKIESQKLGFNHHTVYTEIIIDASPERVWETLVDFESYPNWAKFFLGYNGELKDKGKGEVAFQSNPDSKPNKFEHTLFYKEGKHFGWSDPFLPGAKDNHWFIVEGLEDGTTKFIQSEEYTGKLIWLLAGYLKRTALKGYPAFNRSLKKEVERRFKT